MTERDTDKLIVGPFKAANAELYGQFCKTVETRRFSVAWEASGVKEGRREGGVRLGVPHSLSGEQRFPETSFIYAGSSVVSIYERDFARADRAGVFRKFMENSKAGVSPGFGENLPCRVFNNLVKNLKDEASFSTLVSSSERAIMFLKRARIRRRSEARGATAFQERVSE